MVSHVFTHHSPGSDPNKQGRKSSLVARVRGTAPEGMMWTSLPKRSHIVMLDADVHFQYTVRTWLFRQFDLFSCIMAGALMDALRKIHPSLLIVSGDPNSAEGMAIAALLRKDPAFSGLPVLWLLNGHEPTSSSNPWTRAPFQLRKPVERRQLLNKILEILCHPPAPPNKPLGSKARPLRTLG